MVSSTVELTIDDIKVVTPVLNLALAHQKDRVTEEVTNVTFNFTEGWFRVRLNQLRQHWRKC